MRLLDALIAARRLCARRQEAEANAALLLAIGDQARRPGIACCQRRPENAVGDEAQQHRMHLADDGAPEASRRCRAYPSQRAHARTPSSVGDRDIGRIGRIDDGVEGLDVDELARADRTQDGLVQ